MLNHLQIADRRERWMVGLADAALAAAATALRPLRRRAPAGSRPRRILLLRLERIGDLLMSWPAIAAVVRLAPDAQIDLVVGSWNEPLARLMNVSRVLSLDAGWLARGGAAASWPALIGRARAWRGAGYDWAINFEGDIRSHLLMACSGAPRRIGFDMAGGGPLLTDRVGYDPSTHVADNALRLVEHAFGTAIGTSRTVPEQRLAAPPDARERARAILAELGPPAGPLVGIHVSGGREVKQWDPRRFGDVAASLAMAHGARLLFTGSRTDLPLVETAMARVPATAAAIHVCGRSDLLTLAALLERCALFVTGDTGPMHLAAAVGTPLVAIFGPSDARRWGPLSSRARVVSSDVACRPCNRIRRPPAHCVGTVPDCLDAIGVERVVAAANEMLAAAMSEATDAR